MRKKNKNRPLLSQNGNLFQIGDLIAGVSVAFIAIPQALAYADLAGMPPHTGLYAVILATLAGSLLASSPYIQAGPVATTSLLTFGALSNIAAPYSSEYLAAAGLLAIIVGLVRIAIGLMRFGQIAYLLSQPVLVGFISAAGILIISSQIPTMLGVVSSGSVIQKAFFSLTNYSAWQPLSILLAFATFFLIKLGKRLHPLFPSVLLAVAIGILVSKYTNYQGQVVGNIPTTLPLLNLHLNFEHLKQLIFSGSVIAVIGFSEATSIARTYATLDRSHWSPNQEFISQGLANIASGLFGGFPVGASFSRSSVNRLAGAKSHWSSFVTGLTVLAIIPFANVFYSLPKAVLAGIIVTSVISIIKFPELLELYKYSKPQGSIAWLTFFFTLLLAPRIELGILIGIALAVVHHLRREQKLVYEHWKDEDGLHIEPQGVMWFGSSASMEEEFLGIIASKPDIDKLHFHLGGIGRIDLSAAITLQNIIKDANKLGIECYLHDVPPMAQAWIDRVWGNVLEHID